MALLKQNGTVIFIEGTNIDFYVENLSVYAGICHGKDNSNEARLKHIMKVGHHSVLRFGYATFKILNISSVCSHQLVRHKHLDYLQESQRYTEQDEIDYVLPEKLHNADYLTEAGKALLQRCSAFYKVLREYGYSKEDARYFLPRAHIYNMFITGNFHAWFDFLTLRTTPKAQKEIREIAQKIGRDLNAKYPLIFNTEYIPTLKLS